MPWLADQYGRKWPVIISYLIFLFACVIAAIGESIYTLYVVLFICGMTFPGRVIIALNYLLEFNPIRRKDRVMFSKQMSHSMMTLTLTIFF